MRKALLLLIRIVIFALLTLAFVVIVEFVAGEILVAWYMNHNNITIRAELSEDYGLGMLALLTSVIVILVSLPLAAYFGWRWVAAAFQRFGFVSD